ncbi:unnamed protein product [Haemonchus placei]|uniref:Transposase n=1 Tax=Haemonchus placei TaxID=6290 RepID=A0A0N4X9P9_HAEPC|nr:unnamed protein product [Haemonchus placei]
MNFYILGYIMYSKQKHQHRYQAMSVPEVLSIRNCAFEIFGLLGIKGRLLRKGSEWNILLVHLGKV